MGRRFGRVGGEGGGGNRGRDGPTARRPTGSRRGASMASTRAHGIRVREGWARANRAGVGKPSVARMAKLGFPRASGGHGCPKRASGEMARAHPEPARGEPRPTARRPAVQVPGGFWLGKRFGRVGGEGRGGNRGRDGPTARRPTGSRRGGFYGVHTRTRNTGSRGVGPCQSSRRWETKRSQDGEAWFPTSERRAWMPEVSVRRDGTGPPRARAR